MAQITTIKRVAIATVMDEGSREHLRGMVHKAFPNAHVWIGTPLDAEGVTVFGTTETDEWEALNIIDAMLEGMQIAPK